MDGERPMENWTASTMQSTIRSKRWSASYIWKTTWRTNEGWVHCYVELLEASEGADDGTAILVEHGGRVSREDGGGQSVGRGIYKRHRSIDVTRSWFVDHGTSRNCGRVTITNAVIAP